MGSNQLIYLRFQPSGRQKNFYQCLLIYNEKFRIKPDINNTVQVWMLEERLWNRWEKIFRHEDIHVVGRMKDHLLIPPVIYTIKNNIPEKPLKLKPNNGWDKPRKLKRLKIKREDLPDSLKY